MWGEVFQSFNELQHCLPNTVVGVVRRRSVSERECLFEGGLVSVKDGESGIDVWSWSFGDYVVGY